MQCSSDLIRRKDESPFVGLFLFCRALLQCSFDLIRLSSREAHTRVVSGSEEHCKRALQNRKSPTKQKEPYKTERALQKGSHHLVVSDRKSTAKEPYKTQRAVRKSPTKQKEPYVRDLKNRKRNTKVSYTKGKT